MSKYESQADDSNAICPYCGNSYQVESEDYVLNERAETCDKCGKSFYLESFVDVTHRTSPDCDLNGDDHDWEEKTLHKICRVCGVFALLP